jgi:LysR family glycine cleavage system transcriptional activator
MEGKPFHVEYPESRPDDPTVLALTGWLMAVPGGLCEVTG